MSVFALRPYVFYQYIFVLMEYVVLFLKVYLYFMETYDNVRISKSTEQRVCSNNIFEINLKLLQHEILEKLVTFINDEIKKLITKLK